MRVCKGDNIWLKDRVIFGCWKREFWWEIELIWKIKRILNSLKSEDKIFLIDVTLKKRFFRMFKEEPKWGNFVFKIVIKANFELNFSFSKPKKS